jgi:RNA polymerase-binding transcription factor DksA
VAYYRDLADMKRGREIVTTFGKYLARFRDFLGLNEKQIKQLADNYLTLHAGFNDLSLDYIDGRCENNQESVNEQQDKWFNAYHEDNSSERYERCHSCMTNKRAVKVYANPKSVLKLAVLKDEQGYIHGRSIVRDDEHKGYIRLYPHASESKLGNFLKQKLSADGYTDRVNLNGVYLDGKWLSEYDSYSVPYIDGQSHDELGEKWVYAVEKTINDRDYLHIESEYDTDFYLENTNGRSYQDGDDEDDNYTYCENCDESIHEDDAHTLDQERLCLSCFEDVAREVITPRS